MNVTSGQCRDALGMSDASLNTEKTLQGAGQCMQSDGKLVRSK